MKPRVWHRWDGWVITCPGYGLNRASYVLGPFLAWRTAVKLALNSTGCSSSVTTVIRTPEPRPQGRQYGARIPLEYR